MKVVKDLDFTNCDKDKLKREAETSYFELKEFFNSEFQLATHLSRHTNKSANTIYKLLHYFSFRNEKTIINFLIAAHNLKKELHHIKPAGVLALVVAPTLHREECITIIEQLKEININIDCPQLYYDLKCEKEKEMYIQHLQMHKSYSFIVYKSNEFYRFLNSISKKLDIEKFDIDEPNIIDVIYKKAISITLASNSKKSPPPPHI